MFEGVSDNQLLAVCITVALQLLGVDYACARRLSCERLNISFRSLTTKVKHYYQSLVKLLEKHSFACALAPPLLSVKGLPKNNVFLLDVKAALNHYKECPTKDELLTDPEYHCLLNTIVATNTKASSKELDKKRNFADNSQKAPHKSDHASLVESSSENQQRLLKVAQYKECVQNRRSPELALDAEDLVVLKLVLYGLEDLICIGQWEEGKDLIQQLYRKK
jgi:hypothetical protein